MNYSFYKYNVTFLLILREWLSLDVQENYTRASSKLLLLSSSFTVTRGVQIWKNINTEHTYLPITYFLFTERAQEPTKLPSKKKRNGFDFSTRVLGR